MTVVRNVGWILLFFAVMAAMLVPLMIVTDRSVPVGVQAAIVAVATVVCQLLRRRPVTEVTGRFDACWLLDLARGLGFGALLMLVPAAFLFAFGFVRWTWSGANVIATLPLVAAVAITEELLFRGFVFQRLIDAAGPWLAQLIIAAYFVLTHSTALATAGSVRPLATVNIFIASLLFGLAYLRTRGLAMPLGLHFAANATQGTLLGFGVSGSTEASVLSPLRAPSPAWLTGGPFGLEASLPGLVTLVAVWMVAQQRWGKT